MAGISGKLPLHIERAVRAVRRELFLPAEQRAHAAEDCPLPIGHAQTISQPSLVAYMTAQLDPTPSSRVLEVGTGSGYQTAILAELAQEVFTIERLPELAEAAQRRLADLEYTNIHFRVGDGAFGWPEAAPFDRIMVTAAAETLPAALLAQLEAGGRLIAPVGSVQADSQVLVRIDKSSDGSVRESELCGVRFVPLISHAPPRTDGDQR